VPRAEAKACIAFAGACFKQSPFATAGNRPAILEVRPLLTAVQLAGLQQAGMVRVRTLRRRSIVSANGIKAHLEEFQRLPAASRRNIHRQRRRLGTTTLWQARTADGYGSGRMEGSRASRPMVADGTPAPEGAPLNPPAVDVMCVCGRVMRVRS
jgi:hypothetical protein